LLLVAGYWLIVTTHLFIAACLCGKPEANGQKQVASYQLDFTTPGSFPSDANTRKQIRQSPNFLRYALGRPQTGQRLYCRTLNLDSRIAFNLSDFFAKSSSLISKRHAQQIQ
jgi:hypothetical protein